MLTPHRASLPASAVDPRLAVWLTRYGDGVSAPPSAHREVFELLEEGRLPPRLRHRERTRAGEVITYVREGTLAYEDSTGRVGVVRAGEFQRMSLGTGSLYQEINASSTDWAHAFQIWLGAGARLRPGQERRRFSSAERRGRLCVVASPDARDGSLRLEQDLLVFSGLLGRGQHVAHVLDPDRNALLYVVEGVLEVAPNLVLKTGDGMSASGEPTLSLTAHEETEILLVDIPRRPDPGADPASGPQPPPD